jgi:hypothetical protein
MTYSLRPSSKSPTGAAVGFLIPILGRANEKIRDAVFYIQLSFWAAGRSVRGGLKAPNWTSHGEYGLYQIRSAVDKVLPALDSYISGSGDQDMLAWRGQLSLHRLHAVRPSGQYITWPGVARFVESNPCAHYKFTVRVCTFSPTSNIGLASDCTMELPCSACGIFQVRLRYRLEFADLCALDHSTDAHSWPLPYHYCPDGWQQCYPTGRPAERMTTCSSATPGCEGDFAGFGS